MIDLVTQAKIKNFMCKAKALCVLYIVLTLALLACRLGIPDLYNSSTPVSKADRIVTGIYAPILLISWILENLFVYYFYDTSIQFVKILE